MDPESCLARKPWDPLGLQGGDDAIVSACHRHFPFLSSFFFTLSHREYRQAGRVSGLQNVFLPWEFSFSVDFVNDCEKRCLHKQGCIYYEFDCKLSVCRLQRLNTSQEQNFIQNDRYITGTALLLLMVMLLVILMMMMTVIIMMVMTKNDNRKVRHCLFTYRGIRVHDHT